MEEVAKTKTIKAKKNDYPNKIMTAIMDNTLRGIVRISNELNIKREDIVSLLKENGQFVLIYYK